MQIDFNSIIDKVRRYKQTDAFKKRMDEYINSLVAKNIFVTNSGEAILTDDVIKYATSIFIDILRDTAASCNLPPSVMEHFNSLQIVGTEESENSTVDIYVSFGDDLHRTSLLNIGKGKKKKMKYTGNGIDNIVSLFDTGYLAGAQVTGLWQSHGIIVGSKTYRDALNFMSSAVDSFNVQFGKMFDVVAEISADTMYYNR